MSIFLERGYVEVEAEWLGGSPSEFAGGSTGSLPLIERSFGEHHDFVSPYGYPMCRALAVDQLSALASELREWLAEQNSPSAFVRGFPVPSGYFEQCDELPAALVRGSSTFEIDLTADFETEYSSSLRRDLRRAQREPLEVSESALTESPWFSELYTSTMDRLGAAQSLRYADEYFDRLGVELGDNLRVLTAVGTTQEVIAASLFSKGYEVDEYMLSCSDFDHPLRGYASKLLIHNAALRSQAEGSCALHLGGAPESNPGLLQMKKRFGTRELQFFTMRIIGDQAVYQELCDGAGSRSSEHFPAYRAGTQ